MELFAFGQVNVWENPIDLSIDGLRNNSLAIDAYGNVFVAGCNEQGSTLMKLDNSGKTQWSKSFSASLSSIKIYNNGNIYLVGTQEKGRCDYGNNVVANGLNDTNGVLVKLNSQGLTQWAKAFSEGQSDSTYYDLSLDSEENIYVVGLGSTETTSTTQEWWSDGTVSYIVKGIIVKYSSNGSVIWTYSAESADEKGSYFYSIVIDNENNIYVTCILEPSGIFTIGSIKIDTRNHYDFIPCLIKYNILGSVQWAKPIYDHGSSALIALDAANDIIVGTENSIMNYNQNGNLQWGIKIKIPHAGVVSLAVDSDNNIYASVESTDEDTFIDSESGRAPRHDGWLMKFNPRGDNIWSQSLASDRMNSIFYTVKLDSQGNIFTLAGKYNIYNESIYLNKQVKR
jgi:hypothetical protein